MFAYIEIYAYLCTHQIKLINKLKTNKDYGTSRNHQIN